MEALIKVHGKAQNRTALGIMHAYLELNPNCTLADLQAAFPDSLNPDSGVKVTFKTLEEIKEQMEGMQWKGYFTDDDCLLEFQDGNKAAVVSMWTKPSFDRLVARAQEYGIVVASFEAAEKGFGKKGGYYLEYLKPEVQPNPEKKVAVNINIGGGKKQDGPKKKKSLLWLILALIILALLGALLALANRKPKVVTVVQRDTLTVVNTVRDTVVKVDTVYVQQVEEIAKNFNAAKFKVNSAELNDEAKFALYELVKVMEKNPDLKLLIQGHTSDEGDADYNQKLSEKRAKAAVDFIVSRGIDESRLKYEGKGSSEPLDPDNREVNRRTEFIIID